MDMTLNSEISVFKRGNVSVPTDKTRWQRVSGVRAPLPQYTHTLLTALVFTCRLISAHRPGPGLTTAPPSDRPSPAGWRLMIPWLFVLLEETEDCSVLESCRRVDISRMEGNMFRERLKCTRYHACGASQKRALFIVTPLR